MSTTASDGSLWPEGEKWTVCEAQKATGQNAAMKTHLGCQGKLGHCNIYCDRLELHSTEYWGESSAFPILVFQGCHQEPFFAHWMPLFHRNTHELFPQHLVSAMESTPGHGAWKTWATRSLCDGNGNDVL